jgi:hypothetical protein
MKAAQMQELVVHGDLHVSGDFAAFSADGLPISIRVSGNFQAFQSVRPANGAFIDGPLRIQGDLTCQGDEDSA